MKKELPSGWKEKKISDISEVTSSKRIYEKEYVKNGIPFYRGKEITLLKNKEKIKELLYISEERYIELKNNYGVPNKNDILITAVGTIGNAYMIDDDKPFYFKDGNLIWLKNIKEYPKFLEFLFEYNQNKILEISMGSSQKALTIIKLENLSFYFPPLDEQKRIADILSTFDDLIANLTKLIEKKELYKKGVMQRVLSGKVRFNGFTDEWDKIKIKDLFNNFVEKNHQDKMILASTQDRGVIPYDLLGKDILRDKNSLKNYKLVKKGCFIISLRSFQGGFEYSNYEGIISPAYVVLEPKINISHNFYKYYFKSHYFIKKSLSQYVEGIRDGKQINYEDSKDILLPFPSLEEQNKIAELLSLIDQDIDNLKQILHLRKLQKKGVMQKLLTGEVRV